MVIKAKKWGNSLAIRIPNSYAKEVNIKEDIPLDLTIENDRLIIVPQKNKKKKKKYSLEELLAKVTPENLHGEIDFGPPVGKEIIE